MFENSFSFNGRTGQAEYFVSIIICGILSLFLESFIKASGGKALFLQLFHVVVLWIFIAQSAKRCHDIGMNGWWLFIPFFQFWLLFQPSKKEII